jgi:sialic acid synthase SpsE
MNSLFGVSSREPFIVAEIGKNFICAKEEVSFQRNLEMAFNLIHLAKEAGADAVKFQTHVVDDEQAPMSYTTPHFSGMGRFEWVKRNTESTPPRFWKELAAFCAKEDIVFFSSPMSRGAAWRLEDVDPPLWKVGSGDLLDFVLLDYLAQTEKPIILSTGMSTVEEIDKAVNFLKRRKANITVLHCVSKYPCPPQEQYLDTLAFLRERYSVPIGFSSHSLEIESAVAAAALGVAVIEKHFTTNREAFGADHKVSLLPGEFKAMVGRIRSGEILDPGVFGRGVKILDEVEAAFRPYFRKSLVYGQNVEKGVLLEPNMIYAMRPQLYLHGLPSEAYEEVLEKQLAQDRAKYEPIMATDFKA